MAYPKKLLNEGEEVVVDLHPHWWHFVQPALALVGAIILGIVAIAIDQEWLGWVALVLILGCALWLLTRFISWISTNFVVTSQRVIYRTGVFAKQGIEIPLDRVNTVHFSQRVIERIVGAGDLMIESAGAEGQQRFTDIRDPNRVQRLIHTQMERRENLRRGGGGQATQSDVASQLEKLEGMLERGTLTQDEFDAQKRKLLGG